MKRLVVALFMAALGMFAMTSAAFAVSLSVTPWTYSHGANSGEGVFGDPPVTSKCSAAGLTLIKSGPTSDDSSAGATIGGVSGITLDDLGFDVLAGSHFSGGAPRFNVVTEDEQTHFYGFSAATAQSGAPAGYQRYLFNLSAAGDGSGNGGTGDKKVLSINIVFDEQGEATIKNIDVNDTTVNCVVAAVATPTPSPTAAPTAAPTASTGQLAQTGGGPQLPIGMLLGSGFLLIGLAAVAVRRNRLN
jgi:hypothetical protein